MVDPDALVSIIVPTYNAMPLLDPALFSALTQTHENIEVICVNDGSTDDSLITLKAYAEVDPRFIVIDKENEGYGASMNRGIAASHGEWIAILEPDDWIEPTMIEEMLAFGASFGDVPIDIIKTPYWEVILDGEEERKVKCNYKFSIKQSTEPVTIHELTPLLYRHPSIWSALYRKDFLIENNIEFIPIPGAGWADNPFFIETLICAKGIVYLDKEFYCYRSDTTEKDDAFHKNNPRIPLNRWNQMLDIIERRGATALDVLEGHYKRGFLYLAGVLERHSLDEPEVYEAAKHMCARMDADIVWSIPRISPGLRRAFAELKGIDEPPIDYPAYVKTLVDQTVRHLRTRGPREAVRLVGKYFRTYTKRSGQR